MILYLQSHRRKPVRLTPVMPWQDMQGVVPVGWCEVCGGEIYEGNGKLCNTCEKERLYESAMWNQPLRGLHPGC